VAFVSVTQQFNTATSMGRLVLHILLSFAQFEREMIAERVHARAGPSTSATSSGSSRTSSTSAR